MRKTGSSFRQLATAGWALMLVIGLCVTSVVAQQVLPDDRAVVAEVHETPTAYGCRYHVMAVTTPHPDLFQEYWFWEYRRGSSVEGVYMWATRTGGAVRLGMQFTAPQLVVHIPCLFGR